MANCDDIFQQIQALQQQRRALEESRNVLQSTDPPEGVDGDGPKQGPRPEDPAQRFVFRDRVTGRTIEADFGQMVDMIRGLDDDKIQALIAQSIGSRARPVGSEGQFQNFAQLVDRLGVDGAQEAAELVHVIMGTWRQVNPSDYALITKINDKAEFTQRLADSYAEAGIRLDLDTLAQGIAQDAAPFMTILGKQVRLQVFAQVARDNLVKSIDALAGAITETGLPPGLDGKRAFFDSAAKAIFAERSAALSRRVSGQLLQQLQNDFSSAPAIAGRALEEQLKKEATRIFDGYENLANKESVVGRVIEAAERGVDGLNDLNEIRDTIVRDGVDPETRLDKEMDKLWRRNARAYYKDSQLFNLNTQAIASYLSNKMVYVGEGYRAVFQNAQRLRDPIVGDGFSKVVRQLLPVKLKAGLETAWHSSMLANDVISKGWKEALGEGEPGGLLGSWKAALKDAGEGRMPFGEAADERGGAVMTIEEQYAAARKVLYGESGMPASGDLTPGWSMDKLRSSLGALKEEDNYLIPIAIRDKFFLSMKLLGNHIIENSYKTMFRKEIKLPVAPALQLLAGVDQRTGLRAFMTIRANDLLIKNMLDPELKDLSWTDRKAMVRQQLEDQLYQATPTEQNIADYRKQYDLDEKVTDDEIATRIAAEKIGAPVLNSPEQEAAFQRSREMRMQAPPESGPLAALDKGVMRARENPYVDAVLPYWRSPLAGALWELKFSMPPIIETVDMVFNRAVKKTAPTDEQVAKVVATWYAWIGLAGSWLALESMGALEGSISSNPREKAMGRAAGRVPNSIAGIPGLSNVPILKTLFMYSDLKRAVEQGLVSEYDRKNIFMGLWQVFAGQVLRETGFKQFNEIYDAITSQDPKQWERTFGFMLNGQINPGSGLQRQIERIGSVQGPDLYPVRSTTPSDRYVTDQAGGREPWHDVQERLQSLLYNMVPSLSGQPKKEKDYLGRHLRRFEGVFSGEWPVGFPGLWNSPVHAQLEQLGMLQPPTPLMEGRLKGIPITTELEQEFNEHLHEASPYPISEHPLFASRLKWKPSGSKAGVDLADLLDRVTAGKTQYEALNLLFKSDAWKAWQSDPQASADPRVADAPRNVRMQRIGPKAVKLISDYYTQLATEKVMESPTEAAREWRMIWEATESRRDPEAGEATVDRLQPVSY